MERKRDVSRKQNARVKKHGAGGDMGEDMPYPGPTAIMCIQLSWATPFFSGQADGREALG